MVHEHLLRGKAALGNLLQQLTHLVGVGWGVTVGQVGVGAGIGAGVQPRTPTPDPHHVRELLLHTHQRLGPVGERLCEGLVADAHDAQLELLHRATAEGGLAWLGLGFRVRVRVWVRVRGELG